jgi:DNA-binding transcriptional MerR regulator
MAKSADAFRTISEVAEWLDTPAHVLRFWESKFSQVKPVKRAGGRRYYRPQDMMLLGGIKKLLHEDGMTIKSVQKLLRQEGVKHVAALSSNPNEGKWDSITPPEPEPAPETEVSSVVSFKAPVEDVPQADPILEAEPEETSVSETPDVVESAVEEPPIEVEAPAPEASDSDEPLSDSTIAEDMSETADEQPAETVEDPVEQTTAEFPGFLTQPFEERAAQDAPEKPEIDTESARVLPSEPEAAPSTDAEVTAQPQELPNIIDLLARKQVAELKAKEAELRPIIEEIQAFLEQRS